jgi:hypothetical protein
LCCDWVVAGWLRSFEGYYTTQVNDILSGVTQQLWEDPSRRFVWSEMSFFMRWWETQTEETKTRFRTLVRRGQLEFVGAGWVQHDEANPSYDSSKDADGMGVGILLVEPI